MSIACPSEIEVRPSEASMVIVHHVPPELADRFVQLQEEVTTAGKQAPGYVKTEVYPPAEKDSDQWVIVMTFADQKSLDRWFDSSERIDSVSKMRDEIGTFTIKKMPAGLGAWFAGLDRGENGLDDAPLDQLPGWKMVMAVLLALYPIVMLTMTFLNPWMSGLGLAVQVLIGNALSVCLLQWVLMPPLTAAMQRWLRTPFSKAPYLNLGGALGIAAILGCVTLLFRQISG